MTFLMEIADGAEVHLDECWKQAKYIKIKAEKNCRINMVKPVHVDINNTWIDLSVTGGGVVEIARGCYMGAVTILCDAGRVTIGNDTTINMASVRAIEGASISIGTDCMLGAEIEIDTSDFHAIYDLDTGKILNYGEDVVIEDHVWIANGCHVLKGSKIGRGSIIGAKSLVTGKIPEECVAAGVPAKVIRSRVGWSRLNPRDVPGQAFDVSDPHSL